VAANASLIQRELRQTRPFRTPSQECFLGLLRTSDVLRRHVAAAVEPHGITLQQYNVLRILRGSGPDGLPTLAIAERMIEQAPGITRLIDRLEKKRLVKRERCPNDRRQMLCRITPSGLRLLAASEARVAAADESALAMLSPAELRRLIALLDKVRSRL
jgi:DNA-binding MarR family transcriptional regulator